MKRPNARSRVTSARVPVSPLKRTGRARGAGVGVWFESMRLSTMTVTVSAMIVLGAFTLAPQIQIWVSQRQQIADLQAEVEAAKQELSEMKKERSRWEDPAYIRAQARDRLYYVMPGEVSFLVMDADGVNRSDTSGTVGAALAQQRNINKISKDILRDQNNWVNGLVQSFLRAGVETPEEKK